MASLQLPYYPAALPHKKTLHALLNNTHHLAELTIVTHNGAAGDRSGSNRLGRPRDRLHTTKRDAANRNVRPPGIHAQPRAGNTLQRF